MRYFLLIWLYVYASLVSAAMTSRDRGAEIFQAYCSGCHTLQYAHSPLKTSLPEHHALAWFGKIPPDLSLIVTVRGQKWLHDYLTGFYQDSEQAYGENNTLLPNLMMPNPFSSLSPREKEILIQDLTSFLSEVASPETERRQWLGCWVLLWLLCVNIVLYYLYLLIQKKINTKK